MAEQPTSPPLYLYHTTTTGKNNARLNSLRKIGRITVTDTSPDEEKMGQRNGFFMTSSESAEKMIAAEPGAGGKALGSAMIIKTALPPGGMELDYECEQPRFMAVLKKYKDAVEAIPSGTLRSLGVTFQKIELGPEHKGGMKVTFIPKDGTQPLEAFPYTPIQMTAYDMVIEPWRGKLNTPGLFQEIRDYLARTQGDGFLAFERELIENGLKEANAAGGSQHITLKYVGKEPLPIHDIMVLERDKWQSKPPRRAAL